MLDYDKGSKESTPSLQIVESKLSPTVESLISPMQSTNSRNAAAHKKRFFDKAEHVAELDPIFMKYPKKVN